MYIQETDKMDEGFVRLVRLFVETFFGSEGVPPSHVWAGKEVSGVMQEL